MKDPELFEKEWREAEAAFVKEVDAQRKTAKLQKEGQAVRRREADAARRARLEKVLLPTHGEDLGLAGTHELTTVIHEPFFTHTHTVEIRVKIIVHQSVWWQV